MAIPRLPIIKNWTSAFELLRTVAIPSLAAILRLLPDLSVFCQAKLLILLIWLTL